jgi:hypothetical protein
MPPDLQNANEGELSNGGGGRIRTYVRYAGRFTVCCL